MSQWTKLDAEGYPIGDCATEGCHRHAEWQFFSGIGTDYCGACKEKIDARGKSLRTSIDLPFTPEEVRNGTARQADITERLRGSMPSIVAMRDAATEIERIRSQNTWMRNVIEECLAYIEDDEIAHGRTFRAGRAARAVLGREPPGELHECLD